jgi:hypothetical protein
VRHRHRRPRHRVIAPWPDDKPAPDEIAAAARYVGSAEHKSYPSPAGNPALRSDASRCDPRYADFELVTAVLREAIERRCVSAVFEGDFPKYVWGWLDGQLYEARHINGPQGTYKAYPLEEAEIPRDPEGLLNWEQQDA